MELPPLLNETPATASLFAVTTADGWGLLAVIKQRFEVHANGSVLALRGAKIRPADEPWTPDGATPSSIKYPHDLAPRKPTTDVVVVGDAIAPRGGTIASLDVRAEVGDVARSVRVLGPRRWYDAGGRIAPTDPAPFTSAPMRWEDAYGGVDASGGGPPLEEPRNPVGRGVAKDPARLVGQLVPHIEEPTEPISSHRTKPSPAGLGAIGPSFAPRRSLAGTYDDAWVRTRMPLPPLDLDDHFHQCAPPALQSRQYLLGGEQVRLLGLHRDGAVSFRLPERSFAVSIPGSQHGEHSPSLDTVLLEPNELRLELTWRTCVAWPFQRRRPLPVRVRSLDGAR